MKKLVVTLLLSATGFAMASEKTEIPPQKTNMEEVVVLGYKWNLNKDRQGLLMTGLGGVYIVHEYNKARNEWSYVALSSDRKEKEE